METHLNHFTLKEDGVIGWIENMPEIPEGNIYRDTQWYSETGGYKHPDEWYKDRLQSAISNAIPVVNQEEVEKRICDAVRAMVKNHPYPLQCHVEKKLILHCRQMNGSGCVEGCEVIPMTHGAMNCKFKDKKSEQLALVTFPSSAGVEETQEERYDGFKVTIDDGFVAYEYKFPGGDHLTIHEIAEAISSQTGMEIESHKIINP